MTILFTPRKTRNSFSLLKFIRVSCIIFLLATVSNSAKATHLAGADLTYRWLSGNNYEISVTLYRDCGGVAAPNSVALSYASVSGSHNLAATLPRLSGTGQEITFSCTSEPSNCIGGSTPGLQKYVYRGTITLPSQRTDWVFSFQTCCRNCAITTIVHSPTCNSDPGMYVEAKLNNLSAPTNSSPTFLNVPVAFICTNQSFTFNHGGNDTDGDSLVYSFIAPKVSSSANVTFNPGYSATSPITSSPAVTINANSGDIVMNPTQLEVGVTAILVSEYRNGVFIGSVTRDMQFWTTNCAPNVLPTATGIDGTASFSTTICAGTTMCFNVFSNDANAGQILDMTWSNGIPAATFMTAGSPYPTGTFCWTPTLADARPQPYSFTVTVRDDNCPLNGFQTYSYTISVPLVAVSITPSGFNGFGVSCNGGSDGSATANPVNGVGPYTYSWSNGQTTQTATGLLANTVYTVTIMTSNGCTTDEDITLTEPALFSTSIAASTNVSCNGGSNGQATANGSGGVAPYTYSWSNGQTTQTATGLAANSYSVTISDANGCSSIENITITEPAVLSASVSSQSNAGCNGEANGSIDLSVSGGTSAYTYLWNTGDTTEDISGLSAGSYSVIVTDANGCTANQNVTITEPGAIVPLITSATINGGANVSCNGATDADASASATGGTTPYDYLWSPGGETTSAITGLGSGPISVLITDANGCSAAANYTITEPAVLTPSLVSVSLYNGGFNISCNGASDGVIDVAVAGGTPGYTYLWSNTETTEDLTALTAGNYTLTVTDLNGCTNNLNVLIAEPAVLAASVSSQSNVGCMGESNGSINLSVVGGAAPYAYSWSNGDTTEDISGLLAGSYTVNVTDANGCTTIQNVTITEPAVLVPLITSAVVSGGSNLLCNGDADATASVAVTGGTSPYTYAWSNGQTSAGVTGLGAGSVSVIVTDDNGCTANDSYSVAEPAALSATLTPSVFVGGANISCPTFADGSIDLDVSGGTAGYTFLWSGGETTEDLNGIPANNYSVTITDANNCTLVQNITLVEPILFTVTFSPSLYPGGVNVSCNGAIDGSIDLTVIGNTGPYTFVWSNGATTEDLSGIGAGTYSVLVTDTNGCTVFATITLTQPLPLNLNGVLSTWIGGNNISCFGFADGSVDLSVNGGTPNYTYLWSNGVTTQDIFGLQAGNISVTVTDTNGCTANQSWNLTEPTPLTVTAAVDFNVSCNGNCDGQASMTSTAGGIAPYTYSWDNGDIGITADSLCPGTYTITVTDANGCTADAMVTITASSSIAITASVTTEVNCFGVCDGIADVTSTTGGVPPFTYLWSNGDTGLTADSLCAGSYDVTVTDANGCTAMTSVTVTQVVPTLVATASVDANATCNGVCDGSGSVIVSGGLAPYSILWSNGDTGNLADSLCGGLVTVTVTDANGCIATDNFTINEPAVLAVSASIDNDISCNGSCDAVMSVSFTSGGTAPYTYAWSNGDTGLVADSLCAGPITVTVTDANGCTAIASFILGQPVVLSVTAIIDNNSSCLGGCDGAASVSATSGGTPPYTYSWSNGDTGLMADSLCAGTHSVTVTDANGCSASSSITITPAGTLLANQSITQNVSCNGVCDAEATLSPSGGAAPYTIVWSNGDTGPTADSLCAGTYTYNITDDNGCFLTGSITITEPAVLAVSVSVTTVISCNGECDGIASAVSTTGGTAPYTFVWSNGDTGITADSLCAGTYDLTVTDANGCIAMTSITITEPDLLSLSVTVDTDVSCNGICDGQASITNTAGGTAPFTYLWSNGDTGIVADSLCAGTHDVTVTDANGCMANMTFNISEPALLTISAVVDANATCAGGCDGQASVSNTSGGTAPYIYIWSNGDIGITADSLCAGTHSVTVTDANGCIAIASVTITQSGALVANESITQNITCNGDCDGEAIVNPSGGTAPYTIIWSNGDTGAIADSLCAGTYTYDITDDNGCFLTGSITISEPAILTVSAIVSANISCNGFCDGVATVDIVAGGTPPYTFVWSNGDTGIIADSLCDGSYDLMVTDANGCTAMTTILITEPAVLALTVNIDNDATCNGVCDGQASIASTSGGTAPFTYFWSNGDTGTTADSLCAGSHSVTVTDANGCQAAISFTINEPALLEVFLQVDNNAGCNGACDGQVSVLSTNGGTAPYTYSWSNGDTGLVADSLCVGPIIVTVTDANGCIASASTLISAPVVISTSIVINNQPTCNGVCDGMVTAGVTAGGTAPYTYSWSNGDTGTVADSLCAGPITLTVTDANGCIATANFILTDPAVISGVVNVTTAPACVGSCNAIATASAVAGGTAPYTYAWSNGDTGTIADSLCAGAYSLTITDSKGCILILNFNVNDPIAITTSTAVSTPISCNGVCDGSVDLTVSGGTTPYTFLWSNGDTTEDITGLCGGVYTYTVTDATGCTATGSIAVNAPQAISVTNGILPVTCNGGNDGEIDITPSGGNGPYTFLWSNNETTEDITGLSAGPYSVTITDANGCTLTANFTVTEAPPLNVNAGQDQNVCGTSTSMNAVIPFGATGVWTLVSGQGNITDPTLPNTGITGLATGTFATFEWTITLNGCTGSAQVTLKSDEPVTANATAGSLTCDPVYTVQAQIPTVGTGSWSTLPGSLISINNPNAATTTVTGYTVGVNPVIWTVTNGGCVARDTVFITLDTPANCTDKIEMPTAFSPNGDGKNDDFLIKGLDKFPENTLVVFNRWGNEIFTKDTYYREWKGEGPNGEALPDGTYFAVLKVKNYKGSELILKGYVDLRR